MPTPYQPSFHLQKRSCEVSDESGRGSRGNRDTFLCIYVPTFHGLWLMQPTSVASMIKKIRIACPAEVAMGHVYVCIDRVDIAPIIAPYPAKVSLSVRLFGSQKKTVSFCIELDDLCGLGFLELQDLMEIRAKECIGKSLLKRPAD